MNSFSGTEIMSSLSGLSPCIQTLLTGGRGSAIFQINIRIISQDLTSNASLQFSYRGESGGVREATLRIMGYNSVGCLFSSKVFLCSCAFVTRVTQRNSSLSRHKETSRKAGSHPSKNLYTILHSKNRANENCIQLVEPSKPISQPPKYPASEYLNSCRPRISCMNRSAYGRRRCTRAFGGSTRRSSCSSASCTGRP